MHPQKRLEQVAAPLLPAPGQNQGKTSPTARLTEALRGRAHTEGKQRAELVPASGEALLIKEGTTALLTEGALTWGQRSSAEGQVVREDRKGSLL